MSLKLKAYVHSFKQFTSQLLKLTFSLCTYIPRMDVMLDTCTPDTNVYINACTCMTDNQSVMNKKIPLHYCNGKHRVLSC